MPKYLDNDGLLYFWQKIKNTFALVSHSHSISDVTDLQSTLDGKAASSHTHTIANVTNLQTTLDGKAPKSHASTATTYGAGNASNYGHVKLSDATDGTAAAASGGTAATPKAVKDALEAAKSYADSLDTGVTGVKGDAEDTYRTGNVNLTPANIGAAPTSHGHAINDIVNLRTVLEGKANDADFTGATASAAGTHGLVPAPASGKNNALIFGKGEWHDIYLGTGTTANGGRRIYISRDSAEPDDVIATIVIPPAATSAAGLMSKDDKTKLNGIEDNANNYTHPSYTEHSTSKLYKFTNDATGHVNAATAATASDIKTLLGTTAVNRATADASGNNIADTYAKKTDIAGTYKYKGSVASESALPTTGQTTGDVYNIETASSYGAAGANVAWNGTAWDSLGEIFSIESITNSEIDTIVAS